MPFLTNIWSGLKRAIALKIVRWAASMAAGGVTVWLTGLLTKYGVPPDSHIADLVKETVGGVFAVVSGGGALAYSIIDAQNTHAAAASADAKVVTAAVTQSVTAANDPVVRTDTLAALVAGAIAAPPGVDLPPDQARLQQMYAAEKRAGGK